MVKEAMLVRIVCQRESADEVAAGIREMFQSFDQHPNVTVADIPGSSGHRSIMIETDRPYTDENALDILGEPGYDALTRYPGVFSVEAISSLADRPEAMTEVEANRLAARIRQDAPFLQAVTVKPAHSVNEDFTPDEEAFICWIEGQQFCSEIYNATEWGQLFERLSYENRMNEFSMQTEEPDVRPFHRYVLDSPILPHFGSYGYIPLERHAVKNYLLDASLPPWCSGVRTLAGVKTIYTISGVRVPLSVATFSMQPGDQALVVTPDGEIGLLLRERE